MPDLSDVFNPISKSIFEAFKKRPNRKSRRLGGSMIGEKCERKLWYSFRHAADPDFSGRTLRIFQTGHVQEDLIIKEIREAGHDIVGVGDNQIEFEWCDGHFVDKPDGILNGKHPVDIKTANDKNFKKFFKEGPSIRYLAQMALHIEGAIREGLVPKTAKGLFLAVNKNDEQFFELKIPRNSKLAKTLIDKADRVIFSPFVPARLSNDPAFFECKFCDFWELCHKGGKMAEGCRTCIHSEPSKNGTWLCNKKGFSLKDTEAVVDCEDYEGIENK
jgi:CRISPR/Cas system-associated exonuclease Cas4 (RecB family)